MYNSHTMYWYIQIWPDHLIVLLCNESPIRSTSYMRRDVSKNIHINHRLEEFKIYSFEANNYLFRQDSLGYAIRSSASNKATAATSARVGDETANAAIFIDDNTVGTRGAWKYQRVVSHQIISNNSQETPLSTYRPCKCLRSRWGIRRRDGQCRTRNLHSC